MRHSIRFFLGFFLLAALVGLLNLPAQACSCAPSPPPSVAFSQTPVVFVGRAVGSRFQRTVEDGQGNPLTFDVGEVSLEVVEAFRGVKVNETVTVYSGTGGADCGFWFLRGKQYLVYGYVDQKTGQIWTSICTRSRKLEAKEFSEGNEDLTFLRRVVREPEGTTISGTVRDESRIQTDAAYGVGKIALTFATDDGVKYETRTDETGAFRVEGMKAGKYRLKMALPAEYQYSNGTPYETIDVYERGELTIHPEIYSSSRVSGLLVDADSTPVIPGQGDMVLPPDVYLVACNPSGKPIDQGRKDSTFLKPDGTFEFTSVREGHYLLAVGLKEEELRWSCVPITKTFYPNGGDISKAKVIKVKLGETVENLVITLPKRLLRHEVTGVVTGPDGKPLAGVEVFLQNSSSSDSDSDEWENVDSTETDENGRFVLKGYEGTICRVRVWPQDTPRSGLAAAISPVFTLSGNGDKFILKLVPEKEDGPPPNR